MALNLSMVAVAVGLRIYGGSCESGAPVTSPSNLILNGNRFKSKCWDGFLATLIYTGTQCLSFGKNSELNTKLKPLARWYPLWFGLSYQNKFECVFLYGGGVGDGGAVIQMLIDPFFPCASPMIVHCYHVSFGAK